MLKISGGRGGRAVEVLVGLVGKMALVRETVGKMCIRDRLHAFMAFARREPFAHPLASIAARPLAARTVG